jgi:hypothetical protein
LLDEERALLDAGVGAAHDAVIEATWQIESLGVLFWALGRIPRLPPFDTKIDVDEVLDAQPKGADEMQRFVTEATLRPDDELAREEGRSYHWLWRVRAMPRAGKNVLSPNAREGNEGHAAEYPDEPMRDGDLVAYGQPLFRLGLASEEMKTLRGLVELRAHALRWMTDGGEWDDVAMDT